MGTFLKSEIGSFVVPWEGGTNHPEESELSQKRNQNRRDLGVETNMLIFAWVIEIFSSPRASLMAAG